MTETPVKSQFGFHIIRLDDTREAQFPGFDDVKGQIKQRLEQVKAAAVPGRPARQGQDRLQVRAVALRARAERPPCRRTGGLFHGRAGA
jgi:hypothetical protein